MARFNRFKFYLNRPNIKLFLPSPIFFRALEAPPSDPLIASPTLQIFGYAPVLTSNYFVCEKNAEII